FVFRAIDHNPAFAHQRRPRKVGGVSSLRISRVSCAIVGASFACARDAGSDDFRRSTDTARPRRRGEAALLRLLTAAFGTKRTSRGVLAMSAFGGKADNLAHPLLPSPTRLTDAVEKVLVSAGEP